MKNTKNMTTTELKDLKEKSLNTMHLIYGREHKDDESNSEPYFMSWNTIYRNMDIDLKNKAKLESKFSEMKSYFDKNYINTPGGKKDAKEIRKAFYYLCSTSCDQPDSFEPTLTNY